MEKTKKKKLKIIIIILLALLFFIGGALIAFFALRKEDSFEVNYQVKVAAKVSASYAFAGQEYTFDPIEFNPQDDDQSASQRIQFGDINMSYDNHDILFKYTFENRDKIPIKVTLIDNTIKNNVYVGFTVMQNEYEIEGINPEAGMIVSPKEIWTIEMKISVINLEKNATYLSTADNQFTWWLVGVE